MKKLSLIIVSLLLLQIHVGFTQITILQSDVATVGDTVFNAIDTLNVDSILPGSPGANVSWDFSALSNDRQDTLIFLDPNTTPYFDSFPSANIAFSEGDSGFIYMLSAPSSFSILGVAGSMNGTVAAMAFSPPDKLIEFPSTYLTSFTSVSSANDQVYVGDTLYPGPPVVVILDSMRIQNTTTKYDTMDGWGTVITPMGSYQALRQKTVEMTYELIEGHLSNPFPPFSAGWNTYSSSNDTTVSYKWYGNDLGFVIVELSMDSTGTTSAVSYNLKAPPSGIPGKDIAKVSVIAYPNPVSDRLTLAIDGSIPEGSYIEIINYLGQIVLYEQIKSDLSVKLNVHGIRTGIYLYNFKTAKGALLQTGKFAVVK